MTQLQRQNTDSNSTSKTLYKNHHTNHKNALKQPDESTQISEP